MLCPRTASRVTSLRHVDVCQHGGALGILPAETSKIAALIATKMTTIRGGGYVVGALGNEILVHACLSKLIGALCFTLNVALVV